MWRWTLIGLCALLAVAGGWVYLALTARTAPVDANARCVTGVYELASGEHAVVVATDGGETLRYLLADGDRGLMLRKGLGDYAGEDLRVKRPDCTTREAVFVRRGADWPAQKLTFDERAITFDSGGVSLAGKLVLPRGQAVKQVVIWVAGSDDEGEIDRVHWLYTLPLQGVGSFVFDKRGTGGSGGAASANFHIRAADVRAAVGEVRRMTAGTGVEVGLHGASQGGWVAPLAALGGGVDFVIVSYGLAEGVTAEDRDEMAAYVKRAGHGPDALAKLRRLTDITARIVRSRWQEGWDELDAWRAKHEGEPWVASLPSTSYTGFLLKFPRFATAPIGRFIGPLLDKGVSFDYEPLPTLSALKVPQLWLLGGGDVSAPSAATIEILRSLQTAGVPIDLVVFPNAGHGLTQPWPGRNKERLAPGYRDIAAAWAKTRALPEATTGDWQAFPRLKVLGR